MDELQADLELVSVTYDHVDPGGTTGLSVDLLNRGAATDGALEVWVEVDPTSGSTSSPFDAGVVPTGGAVQAAVSIDVSEDYPDNYSFDYVLKAADNNQTWTWDLQLIVGDASMGSMQVDVSAYGLLQIWLGSGDTDSPTVEIPVIQDLVDVGVWDYDVDLTSYAIYLLRMWGYLDGGSAWTLRNPDP